MNGDPLRGRKGNIKTSAAYPPPHLGSPPPPPIHLPRPSYPQAAFRAYQICQAPRCPTNAGQWPHSMPATDTLGAVPIDGYRGIPQAATQTPAAIPPSGYRGAIPQVRIGAASVCSPCPECGAEPHRH